MGSAEYTPLGVQTDHSENNSQEDLLIMERNYARHRLWYLLGNGLLLLTSAIIFALSRHIALQVPIPKDFECSKLFSTPSPAQLAIKYQTVKFNGTFDFPSIYRGLPNPVLDAAWDSISINVKPTQMDKSVLEKIGKRDTPWLVKLREEDGGGFMSSYEMSHQLHCLNLLRKYTYREYYQGSDHSFHNKPDTFRTWHLDHCIEMIRTNLMCASDVGMITYEWVTNWTMPYPDFNTMHQCRDFDAILEWQAENVKHIPIHRLEGEVDRWTEVYLPTPP
ncbi:hypothetical protein BT96DRAFT_992095 [Gymnopus androsaceus JB14]|uniref:Tat pathway signal sequence n=1 Tax=Gymnopus androsaceus JB14 TaxID=1447944 RepID=A0A6A4HWR7_9AGAR|nr:hypothetical protein BT96DRAFT_992095 [Gymnopus androsaceus JB14]